MNIFLRYAKKTDYLPNNFLTRAYDCRMLYILSGTGSINIDGNIFPLKENTLCYYASGVEYYPRSEGELLQFITLNFDFTEQYKHIDRVLAPVAADKFEPAKELLSNKDVDGLFSSYFVFQNAGAFHNIFTEIEEVFNTPSLYSRSLAATLLQTVCYRLLTRPFEKNTLIAGKILEYINRHYAEDINNQSIAQSFNYHPNYLNSVFSACYDVTIHQHIINCRLTRASELLLNTDMSIYDIAARVGFKNPDHFSACFYKKNGIYPSAYRKTGRFV